MRAAAVVTLAVGAFQWARAYPKAHAQTRAQFESGATPRVVFG